MKSLCALALLAGCQITPPTTPKATEEATYKLFDDLGQGTGWAVDEHHMVTAGHMCADADTGGMLTARTSDGLQFQVVVIDWELTTSFDSDVLKDVCLLYSARPLPAPLALAADLPAKDTEAWFVGYPKGQRVKSVGFYVGDTDGVQVWDDYVVTAPCDHGASGSAYVTEAGVFGVLVRGIVVGTQVLPGSYGCVATPLADIKAILVRNGLAAE